MSRGLAPGLALALGPLLVYGQAVHSARAQDNAQAAAPPEPALLEPIEIVLPPLTVRPESAAAREGLSFLVGSIRVEYADPRPELPAAEDLLDARVALTRTGSGYVAPEANRSSKRRPIRRLFADGPVRLHASAILAIGEAMRPAFEGLPLDALSITPDPSQIRLARDPQDDAGDDPARADLRPAGDLSLAFRIDATPLPFPPEASLVRDGRSYPVDAITINYVRPHPDLPDAGGLLETEVALTPTGTGYVAPQPGWPVERGSIRGLLADGPARFHASAIRTISDALLAVFREGEIIGVFIAPDPTQIQLVDPSRVALALEAARAAAARRAEGDPAAAVELDDLPEDVGGLDLRDEGDRGLTLDIYTATVKDIRTIASGDRFPEDERIDNPKHAFVARRSPLKPWSGEGEDPRIDLLRRDLLDEYALLLGRHPGRRVDVAIAPAEGDPGDAELQYLVRENKPWFVFAQLSNTGTEDTDIFRERFGFIHNQFLGIDDSLSIEYVTAGFSESHSVVASYDLPLFGSDRIRVNASGGYNEFTASDVGALAESFTGEGWFWSVGMSARLFQFGQTFVDFVGGVRFQSIEVTNRGLPDGTGRDAVFLPRAGFSLERFTETSSLRALAEVEWSVNSVSAADVDDLERLGRLNPDEQWARLSFDFETSLYLEPLLNPGGWNDPSTPGSSTLAHEIAFRFVGQYAFNNRLIPNFEEVVGGLYSVRGYPESVVAGDTVFHGSIEYRFHVPRVFPINETPPELFGSPFRVAPQQVYGSPDWDLIFKAFFDFGRTWISRPLTIERDEALLSVGTGFELRFLQNMTFRTDWGYVLDATGGDLPGSVSVGDTRLHIALTLLF